MERGSAWRRIRLRGFPGGTLFLDGTDGPGRSEVRGAQLRPDQKYSRRFISDPLHRSHKLARPRKRLSSARGEEVERLGEREGDYLLMSATNARHLVGETGRSEDSRAFRFNSAHHRPGGGKGAPQS